MSHTGEVLRAAEGFQPPGPAEFFLPDFTGHHWDEHGYQVLLTKASALLLLGAVVAVRFDPNGPLSGFTTMPVQIYNMVSQPQEEIITAASAGIVLLLVLLLLMNGLAILIRNRFQRRW